MIFMSKNNKIKQEMNKIEIPNDLSERSKMGVSQAKKEMKKDRKRLNVKGSGIAAAIFVSVGAFTLFNNDLAPNNIANNQNTPVVMEEGGIKIPAIQLPEENMIEVSEEVYLNNRGLSFKIRLLLQPFSCCANRAV